MDPEPERKFLVEFSDAANRFHRTLFRLRERSRARRHEMEMQVISQVEAMLNDDKERERRTSH